MGQEHRSKQAYYRSSIRRSFFGVRQSFRGFCSIQGETVTEAGQHSSHHPFFCPTLTGHRAALG